MTTRTLPRVDTAVVALFTGSLTVMLAGAVALGHAFAEPGPSPTPSVSTPVQTGEPTDPGGPLIDMLPETHPPAPSPGGPS
jgi:hypothetical protein